MRVKRLAYQSENSPFGLWTLPNPVDDPGSAPCYMPYGESSPPIKSGPATGQFTTDQTTTVKSVESDVLKPWEKGSKSGKKIKRGPKGCVGRALASDVVSNDMSSNHSSNSCFENGSNNNTPSTTTVSTWSSSQNSPASHAGQYPVLDVAQHAGRPIAPLLPRPTPYQVIHPDTAQAAIAMSRSTSIDSKSTIQTNTLCREKARPRRERGSCPIDKDAQKRVMDDRKRYTDLVNT